MESSYRNSQQYNYIIDKILTTRLFEHTLSFFAPDLIFRDVNFPLLL